MSWQSLLQTAIGICPFSWYNSHLAHHKPRKVSCCCTSRKKHPKQGLNTLFFFKFRTNPFQHSVQGNYILVMYITCESLFSWLPSTGSQLITWEYNRWPVRKSLITSMASALLNGTIFKICRSTILLRMCFVFVQDCKVQLSR